MSDDTPRTHTEELMIATLGEELAAFDKRFDNTQSLRDEVINRVVDAARFTQLTPENISDEGRILDFATMQNLALKALAEQEKAQATRVKAKLNQAELKQNDNTAEHIAAFFKKLSTGEAIDDVPAIDTQVVEETLSQKEISQDFTILESELRSDPEDLS